METKRLGLVCVVFALVVAWCAQATGQQPDIAVYPDSLGADLYTGMFETQLLTIENLGDADLVWQATVGAVGNSLSTYRFTPPFPVAEAPDGGQPPSRESREGATWARLANLADVHILQDTYHGQTYYSWSTMVADLVARGATVTETSEPITEALLSGYDVVWTTDCSNTWASSEVTALADWVAAGGGLLLEGDNTSSVPAYNAILTAMSAGITYVSEDGTSGVTSKLYGHQTTKDVQTIYLISPIAHLADVTPPAGFLVDDTMSVPNTAYSMVGLGRVVAAADELFGDSSMGLEDNQLFGNQVFDWLVGVQWLSADPLGGTVPAGETVDVSVTFDAWSLEGGDYAAQLVVESNDPDEPLVAVETTLHVTAAPDIAVSDTLFSYGEVFVGGTASEPLTLVNEGTDTLRVSDIGSDEPAYTVDVSAFDLGPHESRDVVVSFTPSSVDTFPGTLTITSNDPDEGTLHVGLWGEGVDAPDVGVSPDSLYSDLLTGETEIQVLTIENTGGSDLIWTLEIEASSALRAGVVRRGAIVSREVPWATSPGEDGPSTRGHDGDIETLNTTAPSEGEPPLAGEYTGDHIHFGITDYGEIMPFQSPVGDEHLQYGAYLCGYTVAYDDAGGTRVKYAVNSSRLGIVPVSYTEITNSASEVVVEVVTRTDDGALEITRLFTFDRSGKSIRVETDLANTSGSELQAVVFKSCADWDMDGSSSNDDWDYDLSRNMVYATEVMYAAVAGQSPPDLMDIDGWEDYHTRDTYVNFPSGPVFSYDGLEVLHYELGDLSTGERASVTTAFAAGSSLAELEEVVDTAFIQWISADPTEGMIPPGSYVDVAVLFDAAGLIGGDYFADVLVSSNDPDEPEVAVPTHLHVTGAPDIAVSDSLLAFGEVDVGSMETRTLHVINVGTDLLTVSDIYTDHPDYWAGVSTFALVPGQSQPVGVTFAPSSDGPITGTLTILSDDPDQGVVEVALEGEGSMPRIWHVPGDAPTIAAGIDSADSHDIVLVAPGVYTGPDSRGLDFEGKEIAVMSSAGPESTLIDCEGLNRAFSFITGENRNASVSGFSITNGSSDRGGAIYVYESSPTITECVFYGNNAGSVGGGAIFCGYGSSPAVLDCGFYDNTASAIGGALRSSFASPEIHGCTFVRNTASLGSGIACNGSTFTLSNSVIAFGNIGGAMDCSGVGEPDVYHNCVFANAGGDSLCGSCHDNLFLDPLFCGLAVRDLTLCANSQCLPTGNAWGEQIGAYDVGCADCSVSPVDYSFFAVANPSGTVTLRWTVADLGMVSGFNIYRSASAEGVFRMVNEDTVPAASPGEFEDVTVWPGSTFWYRLVPVLSDGSEDDVPWAPVSVATTGRLVVALHPPKPNPFSGKTTVEFDVPEDVRTARLAVYNVKGQLVRELFAGSPERGRKAASWDGLDMNGEPASSGVYFVMLETDVTTKTRKLLLVR